MCGTEGGISSMHSCHGNPEMQIGERQRLEISSSYFGLTLRLLPPIHNYLHQLTQTLHLLLNGQLEGPRIDATAHVDREAHPSGQDLGDSGRIILRRGGGV